MRSFYVLVALQQTVNVECKCWSICWGNLLKKSPGPFYYRRLLTKAVLFPLSRDVRDIEERQSWEREREREREGGRWESFLSPWHVSWEQLTLMESVSQSVLRHEQLRGQLLASTAMSEDHSVWPPTVLQRWERTGEMWAEERGVSPCQSDHRPPLPAHHNKTDKYPGKSWKLFFKKIFKLRKNVSAEGRRAVRS